MDIKVLKKSEVDFHRLAELTCIAMERSNLLTEDITEETILHNISERITNNCYDLIFIAENNGKIVGWLAFYEISDSKIVQIWNWHPIVFPNEDESEIANGLIQEALSHLKEIGLHKVTIDFTQVNKDTRSCFNKYLDWYSQAGITEVIEEKFYKKNIDEEDFEAFIPDEYSLGYISETDLDDLFDCWVEIFASSNDQFLLSLDAKGRRDVIDRAIMGHAEPPCVGHLWSPVWARQGRPVWTTHRHPIWARRSRPMWATRSRWV